MTPNPDTPSEAEAATLDARGHRCPVPTLKLRRALQQVAPGAAVVLLADDPMAQIDVPHFCNQNNYKLEDIHAFSGGWRFTVRRTV